ncbi:MAG: Crp/Fnr family transcriptional regulator [Cytophagales bacterium]|nr:Crp/Fnr family transcriptional regulator [Cytophagales bacterium]
MVELICSPSFTLLLITIALKMNFNNLSDMIPLDLASEVLSLLETHHLPKKHLLHREGRICRHIYLIQKGVARTFFYKEGKDITVHIAAEGELITAIDSVISLKRSRYNVELLEDSEVHALSYQALHSLLEKHPHYEKYMRLILEQLYAEGADRIEEFLFYSAKERYDNLMNNKPGLLNRVNLGHIASYLGITQETLSRIRKSP